MHIGPIHLNKVYDGLGKKRIAWALCFLVPRFTIIMTIYTTRCKWY